MADLGKLLALIARLRAPGGCPWDRDQTLADLRAYLVEEAHETAAAIDAVVHAEGTAAAGGPTDADSATDTAADRATDTAWQALGDELGDLLFQAAFVAALAEESGAFSAAEAIDRVHAKMVERHPHVFPPAAGGEREELADAEAVSRLWERRKLERAGGESLLAGVPASLPALLAAYRMTQKAAGVGFDWPDAAAVLAKLDEERAELAAALDPGAAAGAGEEAGRAAVREEIGDLLFTAANLARKLGVDPEAALAATNAKFRRRFAYVEARLAESGRRPDQAELAEMDTLWQEAKRPR